MVHDHTYVCIYTKLCTHMIICERKFLFLGNEAIFLRMDMKKSEIKQLEQWVCVYSIFTSLDLYGNYVIFDIRPVVGKILLVVFSKALIFGSPEIKISVKEDKRSTPVDFLLKFIILDCRNMHYFNNS